MKMPSALRARRREAMLRASTQTTATTKAALRKQTPLGLLPPLYPSEDRPDMDATTAPAEGSGSPTRPRPGKPKSDDSGSAKSVTAALPMDESTVIDALRRQGEDGDGP